MGPQPRHVAPKAQVCTPEALVRVRRLSGTEVQAAFPHKRRPSFTPVVKHSYEAFFVGVCKHVGDVHKFNGRRQFRL